jgi:heptosyltransferase-3
MTVLERLPEGARAAIIRMRSLGDCVLTTPAINLLKRYRPDLSVGVSVEDRYRTIFEGNPAVNEILAPTWQAVRRWKPALCLNLNGGARSQWITALSGARWRAGFANHDTTIAYNITIPRAQRVLGINRTVHTAERIASAFFALGVPVEEVPRAQLFTAEPPVKARYAVLHPFSTTPEKQWPAEHFCEVARYLVLWRITPLFLVAEDEDPQPFAAHEVVRGKLNAVKALLSKASLFIGVDSGPVHIAAAFSVPSVVLFGSKSNPAVWSPWRTDYELVVGPDGLAEVSVSRVIAAIERLRMLEEAHA